jgi:hypothetical protein
VEVALSLLNYPIWVLGIEINQEGYLSREGIEPVGLLILKIEANGITVLVKYEQKLHMVPSEFGGYADLHWRQAVSGVEHKTRDLSNENPA